MSRYGRLTSLRSFSPHVDRRHQWVELSAEMPRFTFPPASSLEQLGVLFKDCCRRLWTILASEGGLYPKCVHCRSYTCSQRCLEESSSKIVLDIGAHTPVSLTTRVV